MSTPDLLMAARRLKTALSKRGLEAYGNPLPGLVASSQVPCRLNGGHGPMVVRFSKRGVLEAVLEGKVVATEHGPTEELRSTGRHPVRSLRISAALWKAVHLRAIEAGLSTSEWVRLAITDRLEREGAPLPQGEGGDEEEPEGEG